MAKKQSCSSTSTTSATIYEEFQPKLEEKEEEGAYILKLHLPDFSREQIRVIYVASTRTIRAQGERPLGKWIRFNKSFFVPDNCNADIIRGDFGDGILKITIPKQSISPPNSAPEKDGAKNAIKDKESTSAPPPPPPKSGGKEETLAVVESEEKKGGVFRGKGKEEPRFMEVAEAAMKMVMEKKEDRSLIVTTGVAVLVIVAVGAYATYKIRSASRSKS